MSNKQPDFQNFKRYKKGKDVTAQNVLTVFTTTFLIMLVFFIGAAKHMTPNVDVAIGEDSATDAKETGLGVKGFIDNRLRAIQSEDSTSIEKKIEKKIQNKFEEDDENEYYSKDLEEKVKIPEVKKVHQEVKPVEKEEVTVKVEKPSQPPKPVEPPTPSAYAPTIKVVVGNYASMEQAKVAQTILQEAGLGLTPFVKNIQGSYTLQVGSFNSEIKAQSLANELLKNNFPARIIKN